MKFGAHAFIWEGTWDRKAARNVISSAAQAGLDCVEIPLLKPQEFEVENVRALLDEFGIEATFSLGLPPSSTLPQYPERAEKFLRGALDKIAAVGGKTLTGVTYGTLGELPGRRPTSEDYKIIARCLKKVAQYAADRDITLGMEPVNRYETYLINTAEQAIEIADAISEPNVFIHLDTYHLNIEENGFKSPIIAAGARMKYIHLSESHRGTPGTGTVNWDEVFSGLQAIDFRGTLVMESFVKLNPDIQRATCMWRDIVTDSEKLVRDGLAFLRSKATEYHLA